MKLLSLNTFNGRVIAVINSKTFHPWGVHFFLPFWIACETYLSHCHMDVARSPGLRCLREGRLAWQEGVLAEAGQRCEVVSVHIVTGQDTC